MPALTLMLGRGLGAVPGVWREARLAVLAVALLSPLAYILVLEAMRSTPVSLVAAARESSIVVGALLGWLVLGEARPLHRLVGAAVVAAGIAAIVLGCDGRSVRRRRAGRPAPRASRRAVASRLGQPGGAARPEVLRRPPPRTLGR